MSQENENYEEGDFDDDYEDDFHNSQPKES